MFFASFVRPHHLTSRPFLDDDDDDDDDTFQQRSPLSMSWDTQCPKLEMLPGRLPDGTRRRG